MKRDYVDQHGCPSGLRGRTQDAVLRNAWVQIPLRAFFLLFMIFLFQYTLLGNESSNESIIFHD